MIAAALAEKYRSLFVIGRGGMGSVEAALEIGESDETRPDSYQRVVALKRLLPDAARDKRRTEMFLREARLAAMLDHPNVVRAFDYGEIDGELYLAMEYVEGQPLSRVLRVLAEAGETLGPAVVAYVLAEVCKGLHAAHDLADESGRPLHLVHRDVSPQNVMLAYDGHVRLLDFGVAKIETENVTKTGEVKGKTAYMSPEQAMGEPLDRRSDLFGVGAILYECVALRRMWGDGTDMEIIRKLALDEPPPFPEDAPAEMRALYTKLVARDAKDRPASAREVADALMELVPDGAAAAKALGAILDQHFSAHASEQRKRLAASLDEVAPSQAARLRESVVPTSGRPTEPAPESASAVANVPASVPAVAAASPSASAPARRSTMLALAALAAVSGVVVFAMRDRAPAPSPRPTESVQQHAQQPAAPPSSVATASSSAPPPSTPEPVHATEPVSSKPAHPTRPFPHAKPSSTPTPPAKPPSSAKQIDVDPNPF